MEEALKAGHVLEPDRDIQFCAEATEVDNASSVNRSDFCIVDLFVYLECVLEDRLLLSFSKAGKICTENLSWAKFHPATDQFVSPSSCPAFGLLLTVRSSNVALD
jgi:hypothetical protein